MSQPAPAPGDTRAGGGRPWEAPGFRPNLLVVMTDSLRPDYVGAYRRAGDAPDLPGQLRSPAGTGARTPHLDRFGAEGAVFERAYAASFPTVPNRNDLHTGRFTFPHRGWSPLPPDVPCLAGALTRAGYASQFYCDTPNQVPMGLQRGFAGWEWHRGQEGDRYVTDPRLNPDPGCPPEKLRGGGAGYRQYLKNRSGWASEEDHFAPRTLRSGMAWLQQLHESRRDTPDGQPSGAPFFLWLDTFDPHEPWDAPPYYVDWYDPGYRGDVLAHAAYGLADYMTDAERQHTKAIYAAEVSMVDKWIGRLLQQVDDLGYRDTTAVVHLSDHGHYFGDHGLQGKPYVEPELLTLYEGLIRTALAVRLPGGRGAGRRVSALAQPPDVTATLLDLAGLGPAALPGLEGRSLLPAIDGATGGDARGDAGPGGAGAVYTSRYPILNGTVSPCAVTTAEWSYQYWPGYPQRERLYHLASDPGQERDLRAERPEVAAGLRAGYLDWLRRRNPELCAWLERIEREPDFRPDAPTLFRGML